MGKGTTKNTSNLGFVQPQQRSLRSRKREFPEDKIIQSSNNQSKHNPQDTTSAALPPCLPQPAQQEATKLSTKQEQTEEQATDSVQEVIALTSCLAARFCAEPLVDKAKKETDYEKSVFTTCIAPGVLENLKITQLSDHNRDKEEEAMEMQEHSRSSSTTPIDQCVAGKDGDAEDCASFCHTVQLEEENGGNKIQSNKCSQQESGPTCKADERDFSNEPAVGMPSKRRKRMGMCGLTEKERSHFLQTQMRENGKEQREAEEKSVEDRGCTGDGNMELNEDKPCSPDDESNVVAEEGDLASELNSPSAQFIPVGPLTKQSEVEKEPLPPICKAVDRTETEAHTLVTASDECSDPWNPTNQTPIHSEVKSGNPTSPSKDCGQGPMSDIDANCPTESAGSKDEPEQRENLTEDVEDTFEEPHRFPTAVSATSALHNLPIECDPDHRERDQTSQQPMDSLARTASLSEMVEMDMLRHGAQPCHSSIDPGLGPGGSENIGVQSGSDAAAAPSGADENGNSGLYDDGTVSSPVATQHPLARVTPDLFGFDYLSDSQLHNINLIEEQGGLVEEVGGPCSSHCHEDATDLVHGLIRELSSLNRIVMATQRKVENLRRGNRGPKNY